MESNSRQPGISNNTSNTTQSSYLQTHNIPPYYPLSTQHSDPVLLNQHGVPQYYGVPQYQHGVLPYQQSTLPMPVVQQGVSPYPYNTPPAQQYSIAPDSCQYNTMPVNQYRIFQNTQIVPQHSLPNQQTAFPIPQQGVPQYQGSTYHTSHPPFISLSTGIPHQLPTAGLHLNTLLGLPQESVTGNVQKNNYPINSNPSLVYPPYPSSIQLPTNNTPHYDSESIADQHLYQQQTVSSMSTSPEDFSFLKRSVQSSQYENILAPQTAQSNNELSDIEPQPVMIQQLSSKGSPKHALSASSPVELQSTNSLNLLPAKIIQIDVSNSSQTHHNDSNNTSQQDDNEDDDPLQSYNHHRETKQNHVATSAISASDQYLDFQTLFETLYPARLKWHNLGLALGLDNTTLECIREKERDDHDKCLRIMIQKLEKTSGKLTWDKISQALDNPTVDKGAIAQRVRTLSSPLYISRHSSSNTSWCVEQYTNFLKDKYKEMSIFPDEWPPPLEEKISKLALIERNHQEIPETEQTQSIEYAYATGNIDNIVTRKKEIKLEQIFNPYRAKQSRFIVLMDGAPGVGKTTLTRKICIDWAEGKLLTDHQIVILKPLREMRGHTTASLSDILYNGPKLKEVIEYIQDKLGLGVMFIFDGFDELSCKQQNEITLSWRIIQGDDFHKCSVLVTSRSYASRPLQEINRVDQHVEVLGFKKEDIEYCIKQNIKDKEKAENVLQMLKQRLDIVSLCYIPLNCRIVLYVYQNLGTLPDTLTQLYEVFILYTIKHYKKKLLQQLQEDIDDIQIDHANKIFQLPLPVKELLEFLSKLAYKGMTEDKLVFEYAEIATVKGSQSLGLLNQITCKVGLEAHYYQFLHLTIQEFLAARHLASVKRNDSEALLELFKTNLHEHRFRMTLIFLSGLTELKFLANEKAFPTVQPIDLSIEHKYKNKTKDLQKEEKERFVFLAQILYESQQTAHNWLLPCLATNSLDLSGHDLTQFDCLVLANFLAMTPEDHVWDEINLSSISHFTNEYLQILLNRKNSWLYLTKKIIIDTSPQSNQKIAIDLLTPLLMNESKAERITISYHHFPVTSCKTIKHYDSSNKTLSKLVVKFSSDHLIKIKSSEISYNQKLSSIKLCPGVFLKLQEYFATSKHISKLCIEDYKIFENCLECGTLGCDAWESVFKLCQYVRHEIQINKKYIEISSYIEAIKYTLLQIKLTTESNITYQHLALIKKNAHHVNFSTLDGRLTLSIGKDNNVYIEIDSECSSQSLVSYLLKQKLLPELQSKIVTIKLNLQSNKIVLDSLEKSKNITSLSIKYLSLLWQPGKSELSIIQNIQKMLENTQTLQTLRFNHCQLNNTYLIKNLEDGLSHNAAVALNIRSSFDSVLHIRSQSLKKLDILLSSSLSPLHLNKQSVNHLAEIMTTCKQLQVLKLMLNDDLCSETFFNALSGNQSLRKLTIWITNKTSILLFRTLPSTSITTLELRHSYYGKALEEEHSLSFKEFVNNNRVVTILRAEINALTNKACSEITFTHDSPLTELSLHTSSRLIQQEGLTILFNSLMSKTLNITILNIGVPSITDSECYQAFKQLLTSNKLTILGIEIECASAISCIAEALSKSCSLQKLTIKKYLVASDLDGELAWTKLFTSLHCNTALKTIIFEAIKSSGTRKIGQSLCEMLQHNKHLQNLAIMDKFIEDTCNLKDFAISYIKRQPLLKLIVETLGMELELVEEIDKLQPDIDYRCCIKHIR